MALVTLTTIYGQDGMAGSRPVINANFTALQSALNSLANFLDPVAKKMDNVIQLNLVLPTPTTTINQVLLNIAGSASIVGNLSIGKELTSNTGNFGIGGVNADGGNIEVKQAANILKTAGDFEVGKRIKVLGKVLLDSVAYAAITPSGYSVANNSIVMVDCAGSLTLDVAQDGQMVDFYMIGAGPVNIQIANFTSMITSPINLTSKGQVLKLWFKDSKWHVIGSHGNINITYAA